MRRFDFEFAGNFRINLVYLRYILLAMLYLCEDFDLKTRRPQLASYVFMEFLLK